LIRAHNFVRHEDLQGKSTYPGRVILSEVKHFSTNQIAAVSAHSALRALRNVLAEHSRQKKGQGPEMIQEVSTGGRLSTTRPRAERRIAVRLPITVRGRDISGVTFEETTSSENLCRGGAAFKTRAEVAVGMDLDISIPLSQTGARRKQKEDDFAAQGRVVHVRDDDTGERLVGVQFINNRFRRLFVPESAA
jgi:PilZ domain